MFPGNFSFNCSVSATLNPKSYFSLLFIDADEMFQYHLLLDACLEGSLTLNVECLAYIDAEEMFQNN
jgi:hypothetical protein